MQNGEHVVREDMLWGFPKYKPGAKWGTNFRTLKNKPVASVARSRAPLRGAGDGLR